MSRARGKRFSYLLIAITIALGSLLAGTPQITSAAPSTASPTHAGKGLAAEQQLSSGWGSVLPNYWWQPGYVPAFYAFRADGTGVRTSYPTGQLSFGTSYPFAWYLSGDTLLLQFPSGYQNVMVLTGYDPNGDELSQSGSKYSPYSFYGCRSGVMPDLIWYSVCHGS